MKMLKVTMEVKSKYWLLGRNLQKIIQNSDKNVNNKLQKIHELKDNTKNSCIFIFNYLVVVKEITSAKKL